mmetsp:Transcript_54396/g.168778  ORF Transcript_54396/g.168778 Transcript_54396/m.168778 type:complete len:252 (-) Transcript_54396:18-773(-)
MGQKAGAICTCCTTSGEACTAEVLKERFATVAMEESLPMRQAHDIHGGAAPKHPANEILRFEVALTGQCAEGYGGQHAPAEDGSESLVVTSVEENSPLAEWNEQQVQAETPEYTVRAGDHIVSVDSVLVGVASMGEQLQMAHSSVRFVVERWPEVVVAALDRRMPADKLGMRTESIERQDGTEVLTLCQVTGGLLGDWNRLAFRDRRFFEVVQPGSAIVRVLDCVGGADRMLQELMNKSSVEIAFKRPSSA